MLYLSSSERTVAVTHEGPLKLEYNYFLQSGEISIDCRAETPVSLLELSPCKLSKIETSYSCSFVGKTE